MNTQGTAVARQTNGGTAVQQVDNPFTNAPVVAQPERAGIASVNARELAEIHGQMQIARSNPRNPVRSMDNIINAFARPGLAEAGMYEYSRGGQKVSGLSIRAAEALAQMWGNIRTGVKELSRVGGQSEIQAYAWDLETGFYDEKTFHVRHWRDTRQGGYQLTDERDIYETVANLAARRKRACILAVIPRDVQEAAERQIELTMRANVEVTPESIKAMVQYFAENWKVTKAMIEKRIQKRVDAISPAQMVILKRIVQSLKDGMGEPSDYFDMSIGEEGEPSDTNGQKQAEGNQQESGSRSGNQSVKEKLRGKQANKASDAGSEAPSEEGGDGQLKL